VTDAVNWNLENFKNRSLPDVAKAWSMTKLTTCHLGRHLYSSSEIDGYVCLIYAFTHTRLF